MIFIFALCTIASWGMVPKATPPPPPSFPRVFLAKGTYVLGDEGVAVNNTIFFNSTGGVRDATQSTASGMMRSILLANPANASDSKLYYVYNIDGKETCDAFTINVPTPLPPPSIAGWGYIHEGMQEGSGVWGLSFGRMNLRIEAPLEVSSGSVIVSTNEEGCSGVNTATMITNPLPYMPKVPAVCTQVDVKAVDIASPNAPPQSWRNVGVRHGGRGFIVSDERMYRPPKTELRNLPTEVDNRPFATSARNQGKLCGGCWAFSTCAAVEVAYNKARNKTNAQWFSPQSLIDCVHGDMNGTALISSKGCFGGWPSTAMNHIVKNGVAWESQYAFDGVTGSRCRPTPTVSALSSYALIAPPAGPSNVDALMKAVAEYGAVVVIISVPASFLYWGGGGVYDDPTCTPSLQHGVVIVGYGTDKSSGKDFWIIKNSFGVSWGEAGYIRMVRGKNMCGVEDFGFIPIPV